MTTTSASPSRPSFQREGFSDSLRGALFAFVKSRVRDAHAAEDLTQEILIRASAKHKTVRYKEKLDSWLFRIARNAVADYYRKARPTEQFDADAHPTETTGETPSNSEENSLKQGIETYVNEVVRGLSPIYSEALLLTEFEGISQVELARRAGISVSAAKSRVQRARAEVRRVIKNCCNLTTDSYGSILECEPQEKQCCKEKCCVNC